MLPRTTKTWHTLRSYCDRTSQQRNALEVTDS